MQRASNAALERPPKGTTTTKAIAIVAIIQYSSLVPLKRKAILIGCSRRPSFFYRHFAQVQAYMNTDYRWKEAIHLDSFAVVRIRKEPTCNIGTWGTRSLPFCDLWAARPGVVSRARAAYDVREPGRNSPNAYSCFQGREPK